MLMVPSLHSTLPYSTLLYSTLLYPNLPYSTLLYPVLLYCMVGYIAPDIIRSDAGGSYDWNVDMFSVSEVMGREVKGLGGGESCC